MIDPNQRFYVSVMGQEKGPFTVIEIRQMLANGQLRQTDMARPDLEDSLWFPVNRIIGVVSEKSWVTALLLSIFVGFLGVDRFYVGHVGLGVLKLVTCGGVGVWAIIDIILFAMDRIRDSNGLPLQR